MADLTHDEIRGLLRQATIDKLQPTEEHMIWVDSVWDDKYVYEFENELFEATFSISDEGLVTIGDTERVKRSFEKFAERSGVQVAKLGTFTSSTGQKVTFTETDLEDIARNGNLLAESKFHDAPLVVSHAEGEIGTGITVAAFGSVTGGYYHNFRVDGDSVVADLRDMPQQASEIVGTSSAKVSPEFYTSEKTNPDFFKAAREVAGDIAGKVLRRVALVDLPAIKTLGDIPAEAFGQAPDVSLLCVDFSEDTTGTPQIKGDEMDQKFIDMQKKIDDLADKFGAQGEEMGELKAENAKLKADNEKATVKLSEQDTAAHKAECQVFCEGLSTSGQLAPAFMEKGIVSFMASLPHESDKVLKFGEGAEAKEQTPLDFFKGVLSSTAKVINFAEIGNPDKTLDESGFMQLVEKYQVAHSGASKAQAMSAVIDSHPAEYESFQEEAQSKTKT